MKKTLFFICMSLISNLCFAEWISTTDQKYQRKSPAIYASVAHARKLISDANGNGNMYSEAYEILDSVLNKNPKFAPAYVQMARLASEKGLLPNNKFDGSSLQAQEQFLSKALKLEPNYDYAIAMMGYTTMFQGRLREAGEYYDRVVKMGSAYPYLPMQLAQLESKRGNHAKALEIATLAYEKNISDPIVAAGAITEIIHAYQGLTGETEQEEEKWYTKRRELDPSAWNWQAHANFRLYRFGDYKKAIEYGNKALSIMDFGVARFTVAAAEYKKWHDIMMYPARHAEAEQAYNNAKKLYPDTSTMIEKLLVSRRLNSVGRVLQYRTTGSN